MRPRMSRRRVPRQPMPTICDCTRMRSPMGVVVVGTDVYATDFGDPPAKNGRLIRSPRMGRSRPSKRASISRFARLRSVHRQLPHDSDLTPYAVLSRPLQADAGAVTTLISNRLSFPLGISSNADWVFIVNYGDITSDGQQTIQRRPRRDLTSYTYFSDFPNGPTHLDIDARYLYWAEMNNGRVVRRPVGADPDAGIDVEVIAPASRRLGALPSTVRSFISRDIAFRSSTVARASDCSCASTTCQGRRPHSSSRSRGSGRRRHRRYRHLHGRPRKRNGVEAGR